MLYRRYGKFSLKDFWVTWILLLLLFFEGIVGIICEVSFSWGFILVAVFIGLEILVPQRELFALNENTLIVKKGKQVRNIVFPDKFVAIIAYADICPNLSKRVTVHNSSWMLKKRYSISFVEGLSLSEVLESLHRDGTYKYTNCLVEELLKSNFFYSFVCNQFILEECLQKKNYSLIIPKSLLHMINIQNLKGDIYIDDGF